MKTRDLIQVLACFAAMLPCTYAMGGSDEFGVFRALKTSMTGAKVKSPPKVHGGEEPGLLGVREFHVDELRRADCCSCDATVAVVEYAYSHADPYFRTELPWLPPCRSLRLRFAVCVTNIRENTGTRPNEHDDVEAAVVDHVQTSDFHDVEAPHASFSVFTIDISSLPDCALPDNVSGVFHDSHHHIKPNVCTVDILRSYQHCASNKHRNPNNVVIEAPPPARSTIDFNVGYVVETTSLLEDFVQQLEALILETAVQGALQCGDGGPLFGPDGNPPQILMFTSMTGDDCDPQVDGSTCIVLETKFTLLVKENLNPDLGAFLGYMDLQKSMDDGTFVAAIPELDRIEYLKPLPLLPPITGPSPAPAPVSGETSQVSVSSWTIGAVVAMCIGGTIAIAAWARNRRTRNQRHMQLLEEMSSTSPSAPVANSPEQPAVVTSSNT